MAHNHHIDKSPMWPEFNHGCPRPVPDDAEPYNTPYAVLGYTEAGEPVFTVHTVDEETYDVEAGGNIIVLKDTTYTISVDGTDIVLTDSYGGVQRVPVLDSATATDTQAGLMSAADKSKLDGIESGAQANVIEGITVNGTAVTVTNKVAAISVSGGGGGGSGDENVIEVVKVNSVALTPDANKAVDITVPTKTSDLTNDSSFVTTSAMTTAINTAIQGAMAASY